MAEEGGRKSDKFIVACITVDVCYTPMGSSTPPIAYQITSTFIDGSDVSSNVFFTGQESFLYNQSFITKVTGDEAGTSGGIKSGTNISRVDPKTASSTVFANKCQVVRHMDACWMNNGNTVGLVYFQDVSSKTIIDETGGVSSTETNLPITEMTPEEKSWLDSANDWIKSKKHELIDHYDKRGVENISQGWTHYPAALLDALGSGLAETLPESIPGIGVEIAADVLGGKILGVAGHAALPLIRKTGLTKIISKNAREIAHGVEDAATSLSHAGQDVANVIKKDGVKITKASKSGIGPYKKVKGHHVHAKAGFKDHVKYDPKEGFSISQQFMKENNLDHAAMTRYQRQAFKELSNSGRSNTIQEHTRIAVEALMEGGANKKTARSLVAESLNTLRKSGVRTPTNIPWYK